MNRVHSAPSVRQIGAERVRLALAKEIPAQPEEQPGVMGSDQAFLGFIRGCLKTRLG